MSKLADLMGDLEVADLDLEEGDIVTDVFVITRVLRANESCPMTSYTHSAGFDDAALQLGAFHLVGNLLTERAQRGWHGDHE